MTWIALVLLGGLASSCGRSAKETAPAPPTSSPCAAPALVPRRLPSGVRRLREGPLFARPDRTRTWSGDGVFVQLLEGFSADHGDDPNVMSVTVRGDRFGNMVRLQTRRGSVALVDWSEQTPCGTKQYAVATKGIGFARTLSIARSLRPAPKE